MSNILKHDFPVSRHFCLFLLKMHMLNSQALSIKLLNMHHKYALQSQVKTVESAHYANSVKGLQVTRKSTHSHVKQNVYLKYMWK